MTSRIIGFMAGFFGQPLLLQPPVLAANSRAVVTANRRAVVTANCRAVVTANRRAASRSSGLLPEARPVRYSLEGAASNRQDRRLEKQGLAEELRHEPDDHRSRPSSPSSP